MSIAGSQADHFRTFRRYIARSVIIVYFFLLISVGLIAMGQERYVLTHGMLGVVLAVAFVPLTAGFVAAIKVLGAADRGQSKRLTAWAAGLCLLGVAMMVAETVIGV
jgi:hypothetical protein